MKPIVFVVICLLLSGCGNIAAISTLPDPVPEQEKNRMEEDVSLTLSQTIFHTSPATLDAVVQNDSPNHFHIGDFYHIEVNKDKAWYIITYSNKVFFENPRFKDYGRTLQANSILHQTFSIEALGIELPPGEYRLVKSFSPKEGPYYKIAIAVPFTIL